eukprot:861121-Pelagomonas_calceolata.AAC.8
MADCGQAGQGPLPLPPFPRCSCLGVAGVDQAMHYLFAEDALKIVGSYLTGSLKTLTRPDLACARGKSLVIVFWVT